MRIKEARQAMTYTQQQMAIRLEISPSFYYNVEGYRMKPDIILGLEIAAVLGRRPEELFQAEFYKPRPKKLPIPGTMDERERRKEQIERIQNQIEAQGQPREERRKERKALSVGDHLEVFKKMHE